MTVGIPGAGIGGLFYLIGALAAPAREAVRAIAGDPRPRQWHLAGRQFVLATAILGGLAGTGWLIGLLAQSEAVTMALGPAPVDTEFPTALARNIAMFTMTTLVVVLVAVEVLRFIVVTARRAQRVAIPALVLVLTGLPSDAAGQSTRTAPAVEFGGTAAGETGAGMLGGSLGADFAAGETGRVGFTYQVRRVSSFGDAMQTRRLGARFNARPRRDLQIGVTGGLWSPGDGNAFGAGTRAEATFRLRKIPSSTGGVIDIRAQHRAVDVTPDLVRSPVLNTRASAAIDVPVGGPWSIRGDGHVAGLSRDGQTNRRFGYGGGLALAVTSSAKLSGQWHRVRHNNPFVIGYFAPASAETVESGLEIEREFERVTLSLDLGGGMQRVQRGGQLMGDWAPAFRGWGMASWQLTPRQQFLLEFEAYDSLIANVVSVSERWRYASVAASFRVTVGR